MEVVIELKKVSWPTKRDLIDATWLVLLSSAFLGLFVGAADFVLSKIVGVVIQ